MSNDTQQLKHEKWLENVFYDDYGAIILTKFNGNEEHVADVRGFGSISNLTRNHPDERIAEKIQDDIGNFIVDAIKEKINNTRSDGWISVEEFNQNLRAIDDFLCDYKDMLIELVKTDLECHQLDDECNNLFDQVNLLHLENINLESIVKTSLGRIRTAISTYMIPEPPKQER